MRVNWSAVLALLAFVLALTLSQPWRGDPGTVEQCMGAESARVLCPEWGQD